MRGSCDGSPTFYNHRMLRFLPTLTIFGLGLLQSIDASQETMAQKRNQLQPVIAITTLSSAELEKTPVTTPIEHDSEVARSEAITIVISIQNCQADAKGRCNASADVVAYTPDGKIHHEMKGISLANKRGTAALNLTAGDVTGVYKVVATVRDLNASRFGKTERLFGVK